MHNGATRIRPATFAPMVEAETTVALGFFTAIQSNDLERVAEYVTTSSGPLLESRNEVSLSQEGDGLLNT